jgi:hypothetical protein
MVLLNFDCGPPTHSTQTQLPTYHKLNATAWRPHTSRSQPSLTLSEAAPPELSPPRTAGYDSLSSVGSASRFSRTTLAVPRSPAPSHHRAYMGHEKATRLRAHEDERVSLSAHLAALKAPRELRPSSVFLSPTRGYDPRTGVQEKCRAPGYYLASIDWPLEQGASPVFRGPGRSDFFAGKSHSSAPFRVAIPRASQEAIEAAIEHPMRHRATQSTLSSRRKRRPRPSGLTYSSDKVVVRHPQLLAPPPPPPPKSPAQLDIERESPAHRLTNATVLPATTKALQQFRSQGKFDGKLFDPAYLERSPYEEAKAADRTRVRRERLENIGAMRMT